jgi:pyruvate,water dikinase
MRLPFSLFKRGKLPSSEGLEPVRSLFSKFRRIQKLNTRTLEKISEMERALGGEYIFDRAFLESSVLELGKSVYQVVYSLNAMAENRYASLFDRFQSIRGSLEDILAGGLGPYAHSLTLSYSLLSWDLEPLAGTFNVCIAEAKNSLGLPAPDGFAVTTEGCRLLLESGSDASGRGFISSLERSVLRETEAIFERRKGPVTFTVVACPAGNGREKGPEPKAINEVQAGDILPAMAEALHEYLRRSDLPPDSPPASVALAVHESVQAAATGSVSAVPASGHPAGLFRIHAVPVDSPDCAETYLISRKYPYGLVQSEICPKEPGANIYLGVTPLSRTEGPFFRGSALLGPGFLRAIAECAATVERVLGRPFELRWARGMADRPIITGAGYHSNFGNPADGEEVYEEPVNAPVLLRSGETVQAGIAAGRTVHIPDDPDVEAVPYGAIGIARTANPNLSTILPRVSALVTELGTSIGHLAAIARELRVPAIFGAKGVLDRIPEGIEATVDAGERTIYEGIVESLLSRPDHGSELNPDDPEYVVLHRLLRWIMPLNLIDPESNSFSAENCRTFHDLIHFSHEKSVEELLNIQNRGKSLTGLSARRLNLKVPVELFLLDLGGGLAASAGSIIAPDEIASVPFRAFVRGLAKRQMWDRNPVPLKAKDIFSGMDRTFSAASGTGVYAGRNHAIVATNYMNVGLRLGYHFSVVDCYLGENVNQNYIYFRFVGGLAGENQRRRRAGLIASVLESLRFKAIIQGDLVTGKLKIAEADEISAALTYLGELTAFTRQLDLVMESDETVAGLLSEFHEKRTAGDNGKEHPSG